MDLPVTMPDISKFYREERDHKYDFEKGQKAVYRLQLEKQMQENTVKRQREEDYRKKYEIQMLKNYPPFGRRTDFTVANPNSFDTMSNASNPASLKDFDSYGMNKPQPPRYSSFDKDVATGQHANQNREANESRTSKDGGVPVRENIGKPVFGTTTGQEPYYPFGKPGAGAPVVDESGQKKTRIAGNLWFNINGQTADDRQDRLENYSLRNSVKNLAKLEPKPKAQNENMNDESWILERKKQFLNQLDSTAKQTMDYRLKKHDMHNSTDYEAARGNAKWFSSNFGRPGAGAPTYDSRRHDVFEVLESPREFFGHNSPRGGVPPMNYYPNIVYSKVSPNVSSSHRNSYEYVPKNGKSHIME